MSMLDSFFKQRFNAAKCKTLLKLTIPRIKLLRNRREIQIRQMRKDIAKLLETGQEATARIRVEHIIREEKMMAAQDIVELFCELIVVRLPIIDAQRECPLDLKEGISSVCFAAPRCVDLPELLQVQMLFAGKYGKEFVSAATELMPECGVNRQLLELLSIHAPAPDVKLKLLKGIAEEHELDWDPSSTESELLKPHEDLLNGSTQFVTGSKVPLPEEKHHERAYTTSEAATRENTDSGEVDSDMLNFPEVPKQLVRPNKVTASAPEMLHFPASALSEADDQEEPHPSGGNNNTSHLESEEKIVEGEQFVPFISPPLQSTSSFLVRERKSPPSSSISKTKNDNKVDLQDVIAAAEAAAETAERAAAAARSAASIAQLRISELDRKNNEDVLDPSVENQFRLHKPMSDVIEKTDLDRQHSIGDPDSASTSPSHSDGRRNYTSHLPTAHPQLAVDPSSSPGHHQHQRVPSIDDETYFSYPNLFTSQVSDLSTHEQSFTDS